MRGVWAIGVALTSATIVSAEPAMLPGAAHKEWGAIGRLNITGYRNRQMCTASLIAPDRVLTAAHCVRDDSGAAIDPAKMRFVAGWFRGSYLAVAEVKSADVPYEGAGQAVAHDIALLTLKQPITDIEPLMTSEPRAESQLRILGYRWDRPHALSDTGLCDFDLGSLNGETVLRLDCAATFGNSGGPVLQPGPDGWSVIGVVSAVGPMGTLAALIPEAMRP